MSALVTQAAYARHRGVSRVSVWRRTVTAGGPIPVYGRRKLIRVAEADRLWVATMSAQGLSNTHGNGNGAAAPSTGSELARAATLGPAPDGRPASCRLPTRP